jgi:hypothetical protein
MRTTRLPVGDRTPPAPIRQRVNPLARRPTYPDNALVGAREERLAGNEALFREVNERVVEVASHYEVKTHTGAVDFTCECGRVDCAETMMMTIVEYEAIVLSRLTLASSRSMSSRRSRA